MKLIFSKKNPPKFPEYIEVSGINYGIEVIFSKKRSSSVSVKDNKLVFRLSSYLSNVKASQHFNDLLKKIVKKLEKKPINVNFKSFNDVLEVGEFYFSGEKYFLEYTKRRGVKLIDNKFYINVHTNKENIEKYIIKLLIDKYFEKIKQYVLALNRQTYNFKVNDVSLKLVSSKWGHCSYDDKIMINLKLLNADVNVLNYVIYHELSHIKYKNHSDFFWKEVSRFCPNYKLLRKKLKENPPVLYN